MKDLYLYMTQNCSLFCIYLR